MAAAIPFIMLGMGVGGTVLSGWGSYQKGIAEEKAYEYNAKISELNAQEIGKKTAYEEDIARTKLKRLMGTQRALYAKAGVDITSGSPLLVLADTAEQAEKELSAIRYGGDIEATKERNQAQLERFYGKSAYQSGLIGALSGGGSGLMGAGSSFYGGLGKAGYGSSGVTSGMKIKSPFSGKYL